MENNYEKRFKDILTELNTEVNFDIKYANISNKLCFLVGEMLGHIDALEIRKDLVEEDDGK